MVGVGRRESVPPSARMRKRVVSRRSGGAGVFSAFIKFSLRIVFKNSSVIETRIRGRIGTAAACKAAAPK